MAKKSMKSISRMAHTTPSLSEISSFNEASLSRVRYGQTIIETATVNYSDGNADVSGNSSSFKNIEETPGLRLRREIDRHGYKYSRFAELSGIDPATLSRFMSNSQSMSERYIHRAADLLKISVEYLACRSNDPRLPNYLPVPNSDEFIDDLVGTQEFTIRSLTHFLSILKVELRWHAVIGDSEFISDDENTWISIAEPEYKLSKELFIQEVKSMGGVKTLWVELTYRGHTRKMKYDLYKLWMKNMLASIELKLQDTFEVYNDISMKVYETELGKSFKDQG